MILSEAIRLYPPAWIIGRDVSSTMRSMVIAFQPGRSSSMSQYITHRDSRFFPDPDKFDPERWRPGA
jgi:cytochrome P450